MGGGQMETPRGLQADAGQEGRFAAAAGLRNIAQTPMQRQSLRLRRAFGLTEAQAIALAVLAWGAGN